MSPLRLPFRHLGTYGRWKPHPVFTSRVRGRLRDKRERNSARRDVHPTSHPGTSRAIARRPCAAGSLCASTTATPTHPKFARRVECRRPSARSVAGVDPVWWTVFGENGRGPQCQERIHRTDGVSTTAGRLGSSRAPDSAPCPSVIIAERDYCCEMTAASQRVRGQERRDAAELPTTDRTSSSRTHGATGPTPPSTPSTV